MAIYGIDLGTTYSCIAKLDANGNPEIIRNQDDASDTLASAVYFESDSNVIVGDAAKEYVETDGERVVQFAKRYIGKTGDESREWTAFDKTYNPIDISALILKTIKQMADDQGENVEDVVITCPAYFGIPERDATRKAGELAGLNVLNLINEPTAAAVSYCAKQFQENRTILVYDLGGGTFDVTIVNMEMITGEDGTEYPKIIVVDSDGDDRLGGADWDEALYQYILEAVLDDNGLEESDLEPEQKQDIRSKVEINKKKLSKKESVKININFNGAPTSVNITREDFNRITANLVQKTLDYVDAILQKNPNVTIDTVLLVGGSTFMPMIQEAVENKFPGIVQKHDPNLAVAMGAALFASMAGGEEVQSDKPIDGQEEEGNNVNSQSSNKKTTVCDKPAIVIADILSRTFGPGVYNENGEYIVDNLLFKGDEMPAKVSKTYYTSENNMDEIILRVFESQSKDKYTIPCVDEAGNPQETDGSLQVRMLGEDGLVLKLPPNTPVNSPIEVQFEMDAAGLYVKAVNPDTGEFVDATIKMNVEVDMENSVVNNFTLSIG
ncbi:MAG: Hsp70 family protein [Clostridiaceae bacterium]|nr:Hsp70 family protein [Clostridiaceae bacterium]